MRWLRFVWLALPLLALGEVGMRVVLASRAPERASIDAAAAYVAESYRSGDLVVVAPWWFAEARAALGHDLLPLRDQARQDDDTISRLWVVAAGGATVDEEGDREPRDRRAFGRCEVRRYDLAPRERVVYDILERLDDARVERQRRGRLEPCRREGPRWRCAERPGRDEWIGTETISDLDHRARRCVWTHPLADGEPIRVTFPNVPVAEKLVGYTSTDYVVGRHLGPDPVSLTVEVGGRVAHRLTHHDADGWSRFEVDLSERTEAGSLTFEISAPRADRRHFCFTAQARDRR